MSQLEARLAALQSAKARVAESVAARAAWLDEFGAAIDEETRAAVAAGEKHDQEVVDRLDAQIAEIEQAMADEARAADPYASSVAQLVALVAEVKSAVRDLTSATQNVDKIVQDIDAQVAELQTLHASNAVAAATEPEEPPAAEIPPSPPTNGLTEEPPEPEFKS